MTRTILFTNARDELSILEWTVHHLALGFDHIHIFDHISVSPISTVLRPLLAATTKVSVERVSIQVVNKMSLIEDGYKLAQKLGFDWMLYIDADEFVVFNHSSTVCEFLVPYSSYDQVGMNWLMFGSNELEADLKPEQTILETYTKCALKLDDPMKSFFNLRCGKEVTQFNSHMYCMADYSNSINVDFKPFQFYCWTYATTAHYASVPAFVAHYVNQSYSTFVKRKINIPRDDYGYFRPLPSKESFHAEFNDIENTEVCAKYNKRNKEMMALYPNTAQHSALDDKYQAACTTPSNINEHVSVLRKYASECASVRELNTGGKESTYGLLRGLCESKQLCKFYSGDATTTPTSGIECVAVDATTSVDLLFINTWHVYGQLKRELEEHSNTVLKYIIMHNTEVDKEDGESVRCGMDIDAQVKSSGYDEIEIRTGLGLAIKEFLRTHFDWEIRERLTNNHGLTVLARKAAVPASANEGFPSAVPASVTVPASANEGFWGPSPIGFVVTRHVTSPTTNLYWKECISQIKLFHPSVPIMIVDDNSNSEYLTADGVNLENCRVVLGEFPGCGELLAYYYLYKLKPFEKAVIIHDSVFLQQPIAVDEVAEVEYLWLFYDNEFVSVPFTHPLLEHLNETEKLKASHNKLQGCFGSMSIITTDFLELLQNKYNLFALVHIVKTRSYRMGVERVLALLAQQENPTVTNRFGNIQVFNQSENYSWGEYIAHKAANLLNGYPIIKVFTGR